MPFISVTKIVALVEEEWAKTRLDPGYGSQLQGVIRSELEEAETKNAATERQLDGSLRSSKVNAGSCSTPTWRKLSVSRFSRSSKSH